VGIYVLKADAHALGCVRVEHASLGLEIPALGVDFEDNLGSLWPRIGHFHVATVKAQLGHARRDASLRSFFKDFNGPNEWKPGNSAPLIFHVFTPDGSGGILPLVGLDWGPK
jgi:hypothetical protein